MMSESRSESPAEVDFSVIRTSIDMGYSMIDQILHGIHYGSAEVRGLLREECDFILECKVCKNLFRSFANFVAHKRVYCVESISDRETEEVVRNLETETVVIQPESPESKDSATEGKTKETVDNIDVNKNDRRTILDAVVQNTYKSNSKEYQLYTKVAERAEQTKAAKVTNTVTLKSIPESSNAVIVEYKDGDQSSEVEEETSARQGKEREKGQQSSLNTDSVKKKSSITEVCANLLEKHSAANGISNKDHLLEEISEPLLERNRKSAPKKLNSSDSKTNEGAKTNLMETDANDKVSEWSGGSKQSINTSKPNSPKKTPSPEKMDTSLSDTPIDNSWMKFCDISHRRCIKCNKEYSSVDGLKYHARMAHGDGTKLSKCPLCLKEFSYFSSVERHLRNVHNNTEQQIAEFRKKMNVRNKYLERVSSENTKSAEKSGKSQPNISSWNRCKNCDKLFSKVKTYKNHIRFNCTQKDKLKSRIPEVKEGEKNTNATATKKKDCPSSNDPQHVYEERQVDTQSLLYKTLTSPSGKSPTVVYVYPKSPVQDQDYGKKKLNKTSGKSSSTVIAEKQKEVSNKDNLTLEEAAESGKTTYSNDRRETRSTSNEHHGKDQNEAHGNSPQVKSAFTKLDDSKTRVELKKLEDRLMTEATGRSPKTPDKGKGLPSHEMRKAAVSTSQKDAHEKVKAKQTSVADQEKTPDKLNNRNINSAFRSSSVSQDMESSGSISCPNSPSSVSSNSADGYSHKFKMTVKEMAELVESANLRKFARERRKHAHNILNKKSKKDGLGGKLVKPMKKNLRGQQIFPKKVYSTRFSSGNKTMGNISKKKDIHIERGRENSDDSNTPTHQLRSREKVTNIDQDARIDNLQKNPRSVTVGNPSKSEVTNASKQPGIDKADDIQDKKLSKELRLLQNTPGFNEQRYYDSSAKLRASREDFAEPECAHSDQKITKTEQQRLNAKEVNKVKSRQSECITKLRVSKESGEFQVTDADLKVNKAERGRLTLQEENDETKTVQGKQLPKNIKGVHNCKGHNLKGYSTVHSKSGEDVSSGLHDSKAGMSQSASEKVKMIKGVAEKQNEKKAENQQIPTEINSGHEAPYSYDLRHTPKAMSDMQSDQGPKIQDNIVNTESNPSNMASEDTESDQVNDQWKKRQTKELRRLRNTSGFNEASYYTSPSRPGLSIEDVEMSQTEDCQSKLSVIKQGTVTPKLPEAENKDDLQNRRLSKELKMLANSPGFNEKGYYISSRASGSAREDKQDGSSPLVQTKPSASLTRKTLQENTTASNMLKQMLLAAQKSVYNSKTIMNRKSPVKGISNLSKSMSHERLEEINMLSQMSEKKESKKLLPQKDVITPPTKKEIAKLSSTEQSKSGKDSMCDTQTAVNDITTVPEPSLPETPVLDKSGTMSDEKSEIDTPSQASTSEERNSRDSPPFIFLTKLPDDVIVSYKMIDAVTTDVGQASTEIPELSDDISHSKNFENDSEVCSNNQSKSDEQEEATKKKLEYQSVSEHKPYRTRLSTGSIVFNSDVLRRLEEDTEREEEWRVVSKGPNKSMTSKESQSITQKSLPDGSGEKPRVSGDEKLFSPMTKEDERIKHQNTVMNVNDSESGKIKDYVRDMNVTLNYTDKDDPTDMSGMRSSLTSNVHRTRLSTGSIFFDPDQCKTSPQKPDSEKGNLIDTTEISKVRKTLTPLEKQRIAGTDKDGLQTTRKEPEKFSLATGVKACEYCKRVFWKIRAYSEHVRRGKCGQYRREKMKQKRSLSQSPRNNASQSPGNNVSQSPGSNVSQFPGSNVSQSPGSNVSQSPGGNASQSPGSNVSLFPVGNASQSPGSNVSQSPGSNVSQSPVGNASQSPGSNVSQSPGGNASQSPGSNVSLFPGSNVSQFSGSNVSQSPGSNVSQSPVGNASQSPGSKVEQRVGSESELSIHIVKRPRVVLETKSKTVFRNESRTESLIQKAVKTTNESNSDKHCVRNDGDNVDTDSTKETVVSLTDIKSELIDAFSETEPEVIKLPSNDTGKTSNTPVLNQTKEIPASAPENARLSTIFTEDSDGESEFSGFSEADLKERELEVCNDLDNSFESEIIDVVGNDSDVEKEEPGKSDISNTTVTVKKTRIKPKRNPWGQKRPYHSTFRSFVCDGKKSRKLVCQQMKTIDRMVDSVHLVCRCCNSKHTSVSNLRQHAIRHLGWKRYKCNICSCLKYNMSEVRLHLNRKHGIQTLDIGLNTLVTDLKKAARKIRISKRSNTLRDLKEKGISSKSSPDTYARPRPNLKPTTTKAGRSIKRKEKEDLSSKVSMAKKKRKSSQKSKGWRMIQLDEKRLSPLKKLVPPEGSDASILSRARERLTHVLNPSGSLPN